MRKIECMCKWWSRYGEGTSRNPNSRLNFRLDVRVKVKFAAHFSVSNELRNNEVVGFRYKVLKLDGWMKVCLCRWMCGLLEFWEGKALVEGWLFVDGSEGERWPMTRSRIWRSQCDIGSERVGSRSKVERDQILRLCVGFEFMVV